MASVIGPNSYLPGKLLNPKPNTPCDEHTDRPSVKTVVGETDSFGSELIDMCQECFDRYQKECEEIAQSPKNCDWCKTLDVCQPMRDIDEGSSGPVYYVCKGCRQSYYKKLDEEARGYFNE